MNPQDVTNRPRDLRLEQARRGRLAHRWGQRRVQISDGAATLIGLLLGLAAIALYFGSGGINP